MTEPYLTSNPSPLIPEPDAVLRQHRLRHLHAAQDEAPREAQARSDPNRQTIALDRARLCARIAEENRARDILLLDLRHATPLVDFFVIATAAARRQARATASEIDHEMKKIGEAKLGMEGFEEGRWTLIDYGDFVVHIFSPEDRAYYAIEEIWGDAPRLEWKDEPAAGHAANSVVEIPRSSRPTL